MVDVRESRMRPEHQEVMDRFIKACQEDERILAAFLGGSYSRGAADEFSDLDLYLITTDEEYDNFYSNRSTWMSRLGEPVFLEDFGIPNIVFYIFESGAEGELGIGSASQFHTIHAGPYRVLLDKRGILAGAVFPGRQPESADQTEKLRRLFCWFWHELSHFITALGRGQLWWAQGQLEVMRGFCVSLVRMRSNFFDQFAGVEPYFKFYHQDAIPVELFSALEATFGPLKKEHLLKAGQVIVQVFKTLALPLAQTHGVSYPEALERVMLKRLAELAENQQDQPYSSI